ncbi:CIR protein PIR protein [Plasmodium vinckei petteri]|uniref:CIR protein PIR protein n=1 Tax=Plasmodium vinckei petteri TaxID=138298 RepID=A0A6V7SEX9_PLAVN|nr:CIR protein PIR protein [Plasmodium vinckei petteri]
MSKAVCRIINHANGNIRFDSNSQNYTLSGGGFDEYCPPVEGNETGKCNNNDQKVSSAFMGLINMLIGNNNENIESGKLAEYAILWLSYKIQQYEKTKTTILKDFFTKNIETNTHYNEKITNCEGNTTNKEFIDKKKYLMNMDIKDISNFYEAFEILCKMYNACNENTKKCTNFLGKAKEFAEKYNKLNNDSNNKSDSYKNVLYSLSTDYNNFKKYCAENNDDCKDNSSFPKIEIPPGPFEIIEATSSSSIASKLIPVLLIFSAIPVFLGIAYKYSLFGFDKRLHRQYLREKIKKIKREMNHYI